MPELPEVETVARTVRAHIEGRTIVDALYLAPRAAQGHPEQMAEYLRGRKILAVRRTGKHILADLDHGRIDLHLRMTGKLLWDAEPGPYARAVLVFEHGRLVFDDVRQFGYLVWREADPPLGPDALGLDGPQFIAILKSSRGRIKPLLLDQSRLAGIGNIYADEALHRAGIHPLARSSRLSTRRAARLHEEIQAVLRESLAAGGSSISDYVDAEGRAGLFQQSHRVYGRAGEPCPNCGAPVRRIVLTQRGTHFCPRCQRR